METYYLMSTDFNSLKRYGASYGKLPGSFAQQKCSGRDQLCNEVCSECIPHIIVVCRIIKRYVGIYTYVGL